MTPERYQRFCETLNRHQPDLTLDLAAIIRTCYAVGITEVHCCTPHFRNHQCQAAGLYNENRLPAESRSDHKNNNRKVNKV